MIEQSVVADAHTSAVRSLGKEDPEFRGSLGYVVSLKPALPQRRGCVYEYTQHCQAPQPGMSLHTQSECDCLGRGGVFNKQAVRTQCQLLKRVWVTSEKREEEAQDRCSSLRETQQSQFAKGTRSKALLFL